MTRVIVLGVSLLLCILGLTTMAEPEPVCTYGVVNWNGEGWIVHLEEGGSISLPTSIESPNVGLEVKNCGAGWQ